MEEIILVRKEDIPQIAQVYVKAFGKTHHENWTRENAEKLLYYWYNRHPDLFFVAKNDNIIVGAITMGIKPWWDGMRLQDGELFIDPKYQKQGIGKLLLLRVLEEAIDKYQTSTLEGITFSGNSFPQNWYEKIGLKKSEDLIIVTGNCSEILKNLKN